ncbi:MAG: cyclic nucleotide-binding domain-containing protein [Deltaproteobacteria bacterium]|nr:cyclic nucleotide-binding domain-containing protein [Deltaproteobacteria bacterium]
MSEQDKINEIPVAKVTGRGKRKKKTEAEAAPNEQPLQARTMAPGVLDTLRTVPFFEPVHSDEEALMALATRMTLRRVPTGTEVLKEGEAGDEVFILFRGEVAVLRRTLDAEEYTVALLRAQDQPFFGELALLDEDKRSATIRATQDSEMLVLRRADFESLGDDLPDVGLAITRSLSRILSRRLRQTNDDVLLLFEALVKEIRGEELN